MDEAKWLAQLQESRRRKDGFLRTNDRSPIPPEARTGFAGVHYFDPDARYRLVLDLDEAAPQQLEVPRSGGDAVHYTRVGTFELALPEGTGRIAAYRTPEHGEELFLMFRDATSGEETYGGGRYLEAKRLRSGRWYVDLNRAYHPTCVYNEAYTCPLPPAENWLPFAVRAGERS